MRPPVSDSGSVLIEALVALMIVAGVLAVTYRSIGESAVRVRAAERARVATMIAQSQLARVGADVPLEAGSVEGDSGGFHWTTRIAAEGGQSSNGVLYRVMVTVGDGPGGASRASLETLRLLPAGR